MKLIAHRGLINGPDKSLENNPDHLISTLEKGYDCEVDLWVVEGQMYLGHDGPQYKVTENFVSNSKFWIHAKNLGALHWLTGTELTYFWHQDDDFTLTSNGYIWTYPEQELTDKSIRLMPEWKDPELTSVAQSVCYGVCSDYIVKIKELLSS